MEGTNNNMKTLEERIVQLENLHEGLVEQTKEICELMIHLRDRFVSEIESLKSKIQKLKQ